MNNILSDFEENSEDAGAVEQNRGGRWERVAEPDGHDSHCAASDLDDSSNPRSPLVRAPARDVFCRLWTLGWCGAMSATKRAPTMATAVFKPEALEKEI